MNIQQFIDNHGIQFSHKPTTRDDQPYWHGASHYECTFTLNKKVLRTKFSKGSAHKGSPPTAAEVLDCLASDATDQSFVDWMDGRDYERNDRVAARKVWKECVRIREKLIFLLGNYEFCVLMDIERL